MVDRRTLAQGLEATPAPLDSAREQAFVYRDESKIPRTAPPHPVSAPMSTRLRSDFVAALKRASLERQLQGVHPNTLRDILEEAVEPWLQRNGYLG